MPRRFDDLSPNARSLARAAVDYMDTLWDSSLNLLSYDERRPTFYPPRQHRPAEAAPHHATRGTAWYALGLLLRNDPSDCDRASQALEGVLRNQFDAPDKPYHGTWRLFDESEEPADPEAAIDWRGWDSNWREFIGITLAIILEDYAEELSADLVRRMDQAMIRAVEGEIHEGRLHPTYTNIALMRAPMDVWAGVRYDRAEWVSQGESWAEEIYRLFRRYDAYNEYNSPTYYGVDLYALGFWRDYTPSDRVRELGVAMEGALWRDIAALYHAEMRNLCGPFSRSYGMDMRHYSTGVGHEIWAALGQEYAPHPELDTPAARSNGMRSGIMHAAVGGAIPEDLWPVFRVFPGEHLFEKTITDAPRISVSAWLSDQVMMGGAYTSGTRNAEGQFHPATLHWIATDGSVNWMRMASGTAVDATVTTRTLTISCTGEPSFQIYAPGGDLNALTKSQWNLPGLSVEVECDAQDAVVDEAWNAMRITYPSATRFVLRV